MYLAYLVTTNTMMAVELLFRFVHKLIQMDFVPYVSMDIVSKTPDVFHAWIKWEQ